jgi:NhaA family Na+:H+ antiporter
MRHIATRTQNVQRQPVMAALGPFARFFQTEASSGVVLIACTLIALIAANSPLSARYLGLWQTPLGIGAGELELSKPLTVWINEGLMAIFFFVVGLEIKREVVAGELASWKRAALPAAAALGGMVIPATIYTLVNLGGSGLSGWGITMATDIAFALGVLALLGSRIPTALKVFLASLAIVDDIGAVLVIAVFYTSMIAWSYLGAAAVCVLALVFANRLGVRHPVIYAFLGVALWISLLPSGVHATIAGIVVALTIPARGVIDSEEFGARSQTLVDEFRQAGYSGPQMMTNERQQSALYALERAAEQFQVPSQRLEHALHPWVVYVIVPVFALANAGVVLTHGVAGAVFDRITLGIVLALTVGKPLGITAFSWLAARLGLGVLPRGLTWRHIVGMSCLGGIGFTMSLFIADLAFAEHGALALAKIGILAGSLIAGCAGWLLLRRS